MFSFNYVAYPGQSKFYAKVLNFAQSIGVPYTHLEPYIDYDSPETKFGNNYSRDESEFVRDSLYENDKLAMEGEIKRDRTNGCNVLNTFILIDPLGDIYPCQGMLFENKNKLGNIFEKKLDDLSKYKPLPCDLFCPCAQNFRDGFR